MLTVNKKALIDALTVAKRFTYKQPSHSELKQAQLSVQANHLCVTTHDLETQAEATLPASGDLITCTVDPKALQEVLKMRTGTDITLSLTDAHLLIDDSPAVPLGNIQQFPTLQADTKLAAAFEMSASEFKQVFTKTTYCMAKDDVRYYLNGALMECRKGEMRLVATDGHRMAMTDTKLPLTFSGDYHGTASILTRNTITRLLACIKKNDKRRAKVKVFGDTHVSFELEGLRVLAKLIDTKYPNYQATLQNYATHGNRVDVVFNKAHLLQQLQAMYTASSNKFKSVLLFVDPANAQLREVDTVEPVTKRVVRKGEIKLDLQCEVMKTPDTLDFIQGFNMDYLLATLKQIDTEQVQFFAISANTQAMLAAVEPNATTHIIMPLRL